MKYENKEIKLKNGQVAYFRVPTADDVAEKPNALRLKDGTMLQEYFMVKEL